MIKLFPLFISLFLAGITVTALARGGDMVNNGGGIAEKNVLFAYDKLEEYIGLCLNSDSCKINKDQRIILKLILNGLPQEKKAPQIFFDSERKSPGKFIIDGLVRVAKTGNRINSPIHINSDLLYSKNEVNDYVPVSTIEAAAILVHELGHHYGHYTHEELDLAGVRLSMFLQQKFIVTPAVPWNTEISVSVLNPSLSGSFPQVLLSVGDSFLDLTAIYKKSVICHAITIPIPILPLPDVQLVNTKPTGSLFHNVHWDKFKEDKNLLSATVVGNISNDCLFKLETGILRINDYKMSVQFQAVKIGNRWHLSENSVKLNQFRDPWYKITLPFGNL